MHSFRVSSALLASPAEVSARAATIEDVNRGRRLQALRGAAA